MLGVVATKITDCDQFDIVEGGVGKFLEAPEVASAHPSAADDGDRQALHGDPFFLTTRGPRSACKGPQGKSTLGGESYGVSTA